MSQVYLGQIVQHLCDKSYEDLKSLVEEFSNGAPGDLERKKALKEHLLDTRHRFLKLLVLTSWCSGNLELLQKVSKQTQQYFDTQENVFQIGQSIKASSNILQIARAPPYDVETSIDVLISGTYLRLPKRILYISGETYREDDIQYLTTVQTLSKLEQLMLSRMLK